MSKDNLVLEDLKAVMCGPVSAYDYKHNGTKDVADDEDVEFWLNPELVLYSSSPTEDSISCGSIKDILDYMGELSHIINHDIAQTYLTTEDLILIYSVGDGDKGQTMYMGGFDRSTGIGLIRTNNVIDKEVIKREVGENNRQLPYQKMTYKERSLDDKLGKYSFRRLLSMLMDIDQHITSDIVGRPLEIYLKDKE